jgi:hypothetical protein
MTDEATAGLYQLTMPAIVMFPDLFVPKAFKGKGGKELGEAKFGSQFIFADPANNADWQGMKAKALAVAKAKHPEVDPKTLNWPFQSGDKAADKRKAKGKSDGEFLRGKGLITARSKFQPNLSVLDNGQIIDLEDDALKAKYKGKFYSGVKAYALFNFVWYDAIKDGDKSGVTAYLNLVYSLGTGDRIGGGRSGSDIFKAYAGVVSNEDPTAGVEDDEMPF